MGVGDDDAFEVLLLLGDIADIGENQIDTVQIEAGKGNAAIHHDPLALVFRTVAVQRQIHANFADAAKRQNTSSSCLVIVLLIHSRERAGDGNMPRPAARLTASDLKHHLIDRADAEPVCHPAFHEQQESSNLWEEVRRGSLKTRRPPHPKNTSPAAMERLVPSSSSSSR